MNRRNFLKKSTFATAGTMLIPMFLQACDSGQILNNNTGKKLVIIQFTGGNDGLNSVVPFTNDIYYKSRPSIAIQASNVLKANNELGFNPNLKILQKLYDNSEVCIINSVGYPDPDLSHFRSMDIWQTASDAKEFLSTGWLGRYLDANCPTPHHALEIDDTLSLALKGINKSGFAMSNPTQLRNTTQNKIVQAVTQSHHDHDHEENIAYLYKTLANTVSSADYLFEKSKIYNSKETYPKGKFGKELKQVAELIISGCDTQIYYVSASGFDTHTNQINQQDRLLASYSEAMTSFVKDLKNNNQWDNTLVMTFSEFGRRVAENGSRGTDHGKANNLYLMGGKLKKTGFYNNAPNLSKLDDGDITFEIDFRNIYATILKDWLQTDNTSILTKSFDSLGIC